MVRGKTVIFGPAQRGLTLVELLVVIAIIGLLVGLLLPAVQSTRESGRRSVCQGNLRQWALALQNHHDAARRFPAAFTPTDAYGWPCEGVCGQGISWVARVLPFIEQSTLHGRIDFNIAAITTSTDPNRSLATTTRFGELFCPSVADEADRRQAAANPPTSQPNTIHYYGIMGVIVPSSLAATYPRYVNGGSWPFAARPAHGIFGMATQGGRPRSTSAKDVTDGLSKTWLLGEISWAGMARQGNANTSSYLTGYNGWGGGQFITPARNIFYPRPINSSRTEIQFMTIASDNAWNNLNWGSNHPGGASFATADGAVQFVNESIDMETFMAAGCMNCGD